MTMSAQSSGSGGTLVGAPSPVSDETRDQFMTRCMLALGDMDAAAKSGLCKMSWDSRLAKRDMDREFSTLMVTLSGDLRQRVIDMSMQIPDEVLHEKGREDEPHVTIKFGLHSDSVDDPKQVVENFPPFVIRLGRTSVFEVRRDDAQYDVVKIEVTGVGIHELNELVSLAIPHTNTQPSFVPHVTLAFVEPGLGANWAGMDDLDGETIVVESVTFSGKKKGDRTEIPLLQLEKTMSDEPKTFRIENSLIQIQKHDSGEVYIEGAVLIPEIIDHQGDIVSAEVIRKAAYDYMKRSQRPGLIHEVIVPSDACALVESRILKSDESINGQELPPGTWVVKFHVIDEDLKEAVLDGKFNGFSIGGTGVAA